MRTNEERITQGIEQKVRALGGSVKAAHGSYLTVS
jgi:hypothetical protein